MKEEFKLKKRTIKYACGCIKEFYGDVCLPADRCEKHNAPVIDDETETL